MDEKKIIEISSNKDLMIAESRVRCIVENAKCIQKVSNAIPYIVQTKK